MNRGESLSIFEHPARMFVLFSHVDALRSQEHELLFILLVASPLSVLVLVKEELLSVFLLKINLKFQTRKQF